MKLMVTGAAASLLATLATSEFSVPEHKLKQFHEGLTRIFQKLEKEIEAPVKDTFWKSSKISVDPLDSFSFLDTRPDLEDHQVHIIPGVVPKADRVHKRDSGCPGGEGNYGFNSFNFMTFTLLVFNLVANVNNNLNNNNNNANKNNINAINQDSNNVASNTNAVNQLMVTVLPIPGKRSVDNLIRKYNKNVAPKCRAPPITEPLADFAFSQLLEITKEPDPQCRGFSACKAVKNLMKYTEIAEAFSKDLFSVGLSPFLSQAKCEAFFPQCVSM